MGKIILVDVHGVLADISTEILKEANARAGTSYVHDDVCQWDIMSLPGLQEVAAAVWTAVKEPGWAHRLKPYPGAVEGLNNLKEIGDVRIVTTPIFSPTWEYDTKMWIQEHFDVSHKDVVTRHDKSGECGDILIDDKPSNIHAWLHEHAPRNPQIRGVLWTRNYNKDARLEFAQERRTNSWHQALLYAQIAQRGMKPEGESI